MVRCRVGEMDSSLVFSPDLLIYSGAAMKSAASSAAGHREAAVCMEAPEEDTVWVPGTG